MMTETYQARVAPWMLACFGAEIAADRTERNHRFLEEALEAVQSGGCTRDEAHQLVDYVFSRPVGALPQEIGGVMVTLAALCLAQGLDMHAAGETELARIWTKVDEIRSKQAAKPKHSPLPQAAAITTEAAGRVTDAFMEREWQAILDWDDRNSPAEYPEHILIDFNELRAFANKAIEAALPHMPAGRVVPDPKAAEGWTKEQLANWLHDARSALNVVGTPYTKAVMEKISIEMLEALGPSPAPSEKGGR